MIDFFNLFTILPLQKWKIVCYQRVKILKSVTVVNKLYRDDLFESLFVSCLWLNICYNYHTIKIRDYVLCVTIQIQEFVEGIAVYPTHSHGMIDPPKVLADIFESLIGAIFVDTDASMNATWEV